MGFAALAAHADTADCILMLNKIFSVFDQILDLHGVHKVHGRIVQLFQLEVLGHVACVSQKCKNLPLQILSLTPGD